MFRLTKREVESRYKGTLFGVSWSLLQPLMMLALYTFVFGVIFGVRWNAERAGGIDFSLALFLGLIAHGIMAEVLSRAPLLIVGNASYVKKVVFPIEILSVVSLLSSLFFAGMSLVLWLLVAFFFTSTFEWQAGSIPDIQTVMSFNVLAVPFVILPILMMSLGLSWIFSALGVYVRDLNQVMGMLVTALLFLSPVFFPIENIPEKFRILLYLNPLTVPIEELRGALMWSKPFDWTQMAISYVYSFCIMVIGLLMFLKLKRGFADVL
jgi:lipopolysaccharide transport system permease protein